MPANTMEQAHAGPQNIPDDVRRVGRRAVLAQLSLPAAGSSLPVVEPTETIDARLEDRRLGAPSPIRQPRLWVQIELFLAGELALIRRRMATTIKLRVNGKEEVLHADDPSMPLLYALA